MVEDKVTELRFNKKQRMDKTDRFYDKLNVSISANNFDLKNKWDSIEACTGLYKCELSSIGIESSMKNVWNRVLYLFQKTVIEDVLYQVMNNNVHGNLLVQSSG